MSLAKARRRAYEKLATGCADRHWEPEGGDEEGAETARVEMDRPEHKGSEQEGGQEGQGGGIDAAGRIDHGQVAALVAGDEFGRRHVMGTGVGRFIQGELVAEAPGDNTHPQDCQSEGKSAQSWALITQLGGLWDRHLTLAR
jgi:hypothetical protein